MQHLEVSGAVRPLKWSLGVKWLNNYYLRVTRFDSLESSSGPPWNRSKII